MIFRFTRFAVAVHLYGFEKSSVVRGRIMEGRIIGCKSILAKLLFSPPLFSLYFC